MWVTTILHFGLTQCEQIWRNLAFDLGKMLQFFGNFLTVDLVLGISWQFLSYGAKVHSFNLPNIVQKMVQVRYKAMEQN